MATIPDDDDTVEVQTLSAPLEPYGQLVKMLMPRALCIAIYDRGSVPLWLSESCDSLELAELAAQALTTASTAGADSCERDGFSRTWGSQTAYIFLLREGDLRLGALAVSTHDGSGGSRSFTLVQGLLRPALQILRRELASQNSLDELRTQLTLRESDLKLLLDASAAGEQSNAEALEQLIRNCVAHFGCELGALLTADRKVSIVHAAAGLPRPAHQELLEKTQRHLLAWVQAQRRTLVLNRPPSTSPFSGMGCKIVACPIQHTVQHVLGAFVLLKPSSSADFDAGQVRIAEMMARHMGQVLQHVHEPATGLLTRPAFDQRVLAALRSADAGSEHCVAYGDVDRLHVINENHGMHVGDEVLGRIAETIRTGLTAGVTAARISGDRFALFFRNQGTDDAQQILMRLCRTIGSLPFEHDGATIELSMSFGLAAVPTTEPPLSHAMAFAEAACKAAKDRGRGRVECYQQADRSIVRRYEDVAIIGSLREAIAGDRFRMEAQPIVDLAQQGPARRFELLLRMMDASGANIAPDKFLCAAERYQLATAVDRWVVQYTLEILSSAAPALERLGAHFAINISGQSLGDDAFPAFLEAKLREYALPASLLSFEITETAAVANIGRAETLIRRLRELGHGIALDDFGRGLSSLTYLKTLPMSALKIDGGLVRDLVGNARSQAMVTAIVQLAQATKLKSTAECIESDAILSAATRLGVDYGQGYAIGRPRPLELVLQELLRAEPARARDVAGPRLTRLGMSLS